jgi:hypothetical protein
MMMNINELPKHNIGSSGDFEIWQSGSDCISVLKPDPESFVFHVFGYCCVTWRCWALSTRMRPTPTTTKKNIKKKLTATTECYKWPKMQPIIKQKKSFDVITKFPHKYSNQKSISSYTMAIFHISVYISQWRIFPLPLEMLCLIVPNLDGEKNKK